MEFRETAPIYRQVAGYIEDMILKGIWKQEDRIPSVRDLSIRFQVNPNTVNKGFTYLQDRDVIRIQRGIGYFVSPHALERVRGIRREQFIGTDLPALFSNMQLIGMGIDELVDRYNDYMHKEKPEN